MMPMPQMANQEPGIAETIINAAGQLGAAGLERFGEHRINSRANNAVRHAQNQLLTTGQTYNDGRLPQRPLLPMREFRRGGSTRGEIGRAIRYGEQRPEVATDDEGNKQLLTDGVGVPVRPSTIDPNPSSSLIREALLSLGGSNPPVVPVSSIPQTDALPLPRENPQELDRTRETQPYENWDRRGHPVVNPPGQPWGNAIADAIRGVPSPQPREAQTGEPTINTAALNAALQPRPMAASVPPQVDPNIRTSILNERQPASPDLPPKLGDDLRRALSNGQPDIPTPRVPAAAAPNVKVGEPPEDLSIPGMRREIRRMNDLINNPAFKNSPENSPPRWRAAIVKYLEGVAQFAAANPQSGAWSLLGGIAPGVVAGINPKFYADSVHRQKIDELMGRLKVEGDWSKQDREAADDDATRTLKLEQARSLKDGKWATKKSGGVSYAVNSKDPRIGYPMTDSDGHPLPPDQQRPVLVDVLGEDGVQVGKGRVNPDGSVTPLTGEGGAPVVTKRVEKVDPESGEKVGSSRNRTSRESEGEKNRQAAATRAAASQAAQDRRQAARIAAGVSGAGELKAGEKRRLLRSARKLDIQADEAAAREEKARANSLRQQAQDLRDEVNGTPVDAQSGMQGGQLNISSAPPAMGTGEFQGKKTPRANIPKFAARWHVSEAEAERRLTDGGAILY
jgi:hypothetical protein